jgi:hypothetical protein
MLVIAMDRALGASWLATPKFAELNSFNGIVVQLATIIA